MFENYKVFKYTLAGRPLVIETGKLAGLANGSCLVRYGETVVLACATASEKPRDGIDFLPLSVDFEERMYAAGKIPGGFLRREGRPGEKAILTSRVIDRPIRPLFPKDLRNDVAISLTVMAVDPDCSHEIAGMIGASIALSISDIPWNGPIGGVFVGHQPHQGTARREHAGVDGCRHDAEDRHDRGRRKGSLRRRYVQRHHARA